MDSPTADPPTVAGDLMALMDASIEQGKAVAIGDGIGAGIAYRDALICFGRLLARLDPASAAAAQAAMGVRDARAESTP